MGERVIDDRVPAFARTNIDLVIRNDEGPVEEGLTWEEARAAIVSRYTDEDEVWIDVADDEPDDEAEDANDYDAVWWDEDGDEDGGEDEL
jgi:hypothetical protein